MLERLKENWIQSYIEVEVVESEDCTQELLDIAGNINLTDTKFGDLRGVNKHLAKEKSYIFKEVDKFVSNYNPENEHGVNDQSGLNGSVFLGRNGSQQMASPMLGLNAKQWARHSVNFAGLSPPINPFADPGLPRTSRAFNPRVSHFKRDKSHFRVKSAINQIKLNDVNRLNSPDFKKSMFKSSNNLDSLITPSRFQNNEFIMNMRESIIPKSHNQKARRGTVRDSVLQQYTKLLTKNKNLDKSITSMNASVYNSFKHL